MIHLLQMIALENLCSVIVCLVSFFSQNRFRSSSAWYARFPLFKPEQHEDPSGSWILLRSRADHLHLCTCQQPFLFAAKGGTIIIGMCALWMGKFTDFVCFNFITFGSLLERGSTSSAIKKQQPLRGGGWWWPVPQVLTFYFSSFHPDVRKSQRVHHSPSLFLISIIPFMCSKLIP